MLNMDDETSNYNKALEDFSSMSRREILIRLGDSVLSQDSIGFFEPSIKQSTDAGKKYLADNYHSIKSFICENKSEIASKKNHAAAAILDILITYLHGLPVVFASLYIADYTVEKFCESNKNDFIRSLDDGLFL
jgi:hypothetical protein